MRLRQRHTPFILLLLLPSLALAAPPSKDSQTTLESTSVVKAKYDKGTKDAPVDGKDGKPHEGPWVEISKKTEKTSSAELVDKELPILKDAPMDKTVYEGKKIPQSNDGVMDDPNRQPPKQGTTGTEGGVSEKDKARKATEDKTGEKVEKVPETPKAHPPLPHSEQEKIPKEKVPSEKDKEKDKTKNPIKGQAEDFVGLEKPSDLPDKLRDGPNPIPNSANKDHLDVSKPKKPRPTKVWKEDVDENESIIRPLHSFMLSLTMIAFAEIGDKTFLIAALMAMKHDRMVVFTGSAGALIIMTVLSAVLGHAVPVLIPKRITAFLASGLFFVFGAKMLREGMAMDPDEGVAEEMQEVEQELQEKEHEALKHGKRRSSITPHAMEMGLGRNRKSRSQSRFPTPPRSPSQSPPRSPSPRRGVVGNVASGLSNLCSLLLSPVWVQTFMMTFLGEWGDRSQIAIIAMAAGKDYWWVTLGALLGHIGCTGVAVIGGRAIAGKVSMKVVTIGGAIAFLVFGIIYFVEALYA